MTITFENDNDVIVYTFERIISYARKHQYIFVAQSVWWLASIVGSTEGLVIHIDNFNKRTNIIERGVSTIPCNAQKELRFDTTLSHIHPDGLFQVRTAVSDIAEQSRQNLRVQGSETSGNSKDKLHDKVLENCEKLLQESAFEKKKIAKLNLKITKKLLKDQPNNNYHTQTAGIENSELRRRKAAGECERCAWPQDR